MKKTLLGAIIFAVFFGIPGFSSARDEERTSRDPGSLTERVRQGVVQVRDGLKARIELRKQEAEDTVRTRLEQARTRLNEQNKKRVKNFWENMAGRLEVLLKGQYRLIDRIGLKLDAAEQNGKETGQLRIKLNDARNLVHQAQNALADSSGEIDHILNENMPSDAMKMVKDLNKEVLGKIKDAHRALADVIGGLRGIGSASVK